MLDIVCAHDKRVRPSRGTHERALCDHSRLGRAEQPRLGHTPPVRLLAPPPQLAGVGDHRRRLVAARDPNDMFVRNLRENPIRKRRQRKAPAPSKVCDAKARLYG